MKLRHALPIGVVLALAVPTFALASGEGTSVLGGQRNPTLNAAKAYAGETQIIAKNATYGTRQSNKGTGGGAIYGCRSAAGASISCLRTVNLNQGTAFDFVTNGLTGGKITTSGGEKAVPFTTNATGVATGLNADRVDSLSADQIIATAADQGAAKGATAGAQQGADLAASRNETAVVSATGVLSLARGAASAAQASTGVYNVTFAADVSKCVPTATLQGTNPGQITVSPTSSTVIRVSTFDQAGAIADSAFSLLVTC